MSNLFLHYVFDIWMQREHPAIQWCRYADDGLLHCKSLQQAKVILRQLTQRFTECGLELHPDKTKIVYCKDANRKRIFQDKSFIFLGYEFRARECRNTKLNSIFSRFTPAVSKAAMKSMCAATKSHNVRNRTDLSIDQIAVWFNPILSGWLNYYGKYNRSSMYQVWRHFNKTLVAWAMKKYSHLRRHKTRAIKFLIRTTQKQPKLFVHWRVGMIGSFA